MFILLAKVDLGEAMQPIQEFPVQRCAFPSPNNKKGGRSPKFPDIYMSNFGKYVLHMTKEEPNLKKLPALSASNNPMCPKNWKLK
ncbi:hypothetical protein LIER_22871 [Lithospermum erythrorhizon]|uniref:Uncharacterized protein n=1 Tax=Lithospermum erythrorhizon TaxID=34254 RepID=A0AAV3QVC3_LITER